jgi:hypothetical protein
MGVMRNAYRILVGKTEGKKSLQEPRLKWDDSKEIYLKERGWQGLE